jgi:hypothetical protein
VSSSWRRLRESAGWPWNLIVPLAFAVGSSQTVLIAFLEPRILGAHALLYTDAARAWLSGGDPWQVGQPGAIFGGPPTLFLPYVPFVALPRDVTRLAWVVGAAVLSGWSLRRLGLPAYWIAFPPIVQAIVLGHPEFLVLWLLVLGLSPRTWGRLSGLAALVKPYAGLALLAERRWAAIGIGLVVLVVTLPILPWARFVTELPQISATIAGQAHGDSTFGDPLLMVAAVVALGSLGLRRALWLATPLLWPFAQPTYKVMTVPQLTPLLATFWALPVPGATLAGIVVEAVLVAIGRRRELPRILAAGLVVKATLPLDGANSLRG